MQSRLPQRERMEHYWAMLEQEMVREGVGEERRMSETRGQRLGWIRALETGGNPFDAATLERLRRQ